MLLVVLNLNVRQTFRDQFKYQVYLYGSKAITYLNAIL